MPLNLIMSEKRSRLVKLDSADATRSIDHQAACPQQAVVREPLGADLRAARLKKQVTLGQVSQDTHISLRHLQNLEEGRYHDLPGGMYNRAFLRSYCAYLDLEAEDFLKRYEQESAPQGEKVIKTKPSRPRVLPEPIRIPPLLVWSVMLLASVVGLYFSRGWIAAVFSPYLSRPSASRMSTPGSHHPTSETKAAEVTPAQANVAPTPVFQPATQPSLPVGPSQVPTSGSTPGLIHLQFQVLQPCWISVISDGNQISSKILQPGEDPAYDAKKHFEIVLGNAGGVYLKINGKSTKPLGKPGEVLKLLINEQTITDLLEKMIDGPSFTAR
jgi:cytoskeletal protein RodZ